MEKKSYDEGKKNSMSAQKIGALNALGFQWAKRKGQAAWNEKYRELIAYKEMHGDCKSSLNSILCPLVRLIAHSVDFSNDFITLWSFLQV